MSVAFAILSRPNLSRNDVNQNNIPRRRTVPNKSLIGMYIDLTWKNSYRQPASSTSKWGLGLWHTL
jgi:hypothetical protein